ncbi:MAG TPA: ribosome maturation factor RimM [Bacillota bacterium]|jgi:16S rRNA processing protein RimM|nr:ribosome maturation factor RimM [Peptococcaceae bacterium MAG4]NLW37768.1 16S rRNA processing protein RimM [Peptococcaceae bacterium]HPZ44276.1 ribosome maturation factor RimM [Bacillota bacterium]HQD76556.1 ribosome maturation factor RimM [Bacillota bacterium]HUM59564.1 ribosome maturation factor RimM [Bacillota bacterium]
MAEEYIRVGKILGTQGNRGAVRVLPLTDYPERFHNMSLVKVKLKEGRQDLQIESVNEHKKFIIIKFRGIEDMNAAEQLRGGYLEITREQLVPLPEGSYYIFEIIGLKVYDLDGAYLGEITDVLQTGANDVYVVETGGKPLLIPALKQVVREVDLQGRRMRVELPEGLME